MPSRAKVYFAAVTLALAIIIGGLALLRSTGTEDMAEIVKVQIGGPFTLTDHTGKTVTDASFRGKFMLVFFGYTYCPDVCPTELQVMAEALSMMGPAASQVAPIFITVDPERDTPEVLKAYVENFSPSLIGLTGTSEQIAAVAKSYRVFYGKAGNATGQDYLMDHSSIIYLMAPDGSFRKHFTYTTDARALAESLASAMADTP